MELRRFFQKTEYWIDMNIKIFQIKTIQKYILLIRKNMFLHFSILLIIIFFSAFSLQADYVFKTYNNVTGENINSIKFVRNFGWMTCDRGIIKYTEDYGKTWHNVNTGLTNDIYNIYADDTKLLVAVGLYKTVIVSEDCGKTWQNREPTGIVGNQTLYDCYIVDGIIWVAGASNLILRSDDKGLTWTKQFEGSQTTYIIHFFNRNQGFAAGENHLYMTSDGGLNWYKIEAGLSFKKIVCLSDYVWMGLTTDNKLYQTYEGPGKWVLLQKFNNQINDFGFFNYFYAWAVSENGLVYRCQESPSGNWESVPYSFSGKSINMITITGSDTLWIAGDNGYFYQYCYETDSQSTIQSAVPNAGGVYYVLAGDTAILTAERTAGLNKYYYRYNWSASNTNLILQNSDKMNTVFSSDTVGIYDIFLTVDDYSGILKYDKARIIVYDTFVTINETEYTPALIGNVNSFLLKKLYHDINCSLTPDNIDLQITLNFADFLGENNLLFINKINKSCFPEIHPEFVQFEEYAYTIINLELFDNITRNRIGENPSIFDSILLKYNLKPGNTAMSGRNFALFEFNETTRKWRQISNSAAYSAISGLSLTYADAKDLCIIGFFPLPDRETQYIKIYPNPFIPNDGDIKTGRNFDGIDNGSGIYFSGAALRNAHIKIITLTGAVVFDCVNDNKEFYQWNVNDKKNRNIPSGLYYAIIESGSYKCVQKIMIIQ